MLTRYSPRCALLALVLAACAGPSFNGSSHNEAPQSQTLTAAPSPQSAERDTASPTTEPTATEQPTTATATGCPPAPRDVPLPEIDDPHNAGEALSTYLNAGGSVDALRELGSEPQVINRLGTSGDFALTDLNGDGFDEVALSLTEPDAFNFQGAVYIAQCRGGRFQIGYQTDDEYPVNYIGPALDMTGDGIEELLIVRRQCGAHTCFEWPQVIGYRGDRLIDLMQDSYFDLPSTGIQLFGPLMDGSYQIHMTGNGIGSVGAGPYQPRSVTWTWNSDMGRFIPGDIRLLPSDYRIHFIHDGDRSFAVGNYYLALDYYDRAIHDDELLDWPSPEMADELRKYGRQELAAYARFRQMLVRLKMNDFASAEVHYQDLLDSHPPDEPGGGFAAMGRVFWEAYVATGEFDAGCEAAQAYAAANRDSVLVHLDYGYGNPTYTPAGLCPTA